MTTITLKRPFEHDGKSYATLEIDEPTLGAVEAFEDAQSAGKGMTAAMAAMLAVDLGWPVAAVRKIRVSDMEAIEEALSPFVRGAKAGTGE